MCGRVFLLLAILRAAECRWRVTRVRTGVQSSGSSRCTKLLASAMIPMMHLGSTILSAVVGRSARAAAAHLMLGHRAMASSSAALQIKALREKSGAPISDVKVEGNSR